MHQMAFAQWTHDIRNALSTVALYVDTLECPDRPQTSKTIASAQALLAKVAAMCSGAAKQSRDGAPPVMRGRVDVTRTIAQVRELVATTLPAGVSLQADTPEPTPVLADAQDVFRILFNLLHNAATIARRTPSLHTIRVTVEHDGAVAVIKVADDGPGVPAVVRKQLFLGGRSTTGGSGHGLAIARELAERNGGTLKLADSTKGATFVIELPLDPSAIDRIATLYGAREALFSASAAEPRGGHTAA
jgi:signal transduction histidine kinase